MLKLLIDDQAFLDPVQTLVETGRSPAQAMAFVIRRLLVSAQLDTSFKVKDFDESLEKLKIRYSDYAEAITTMRKEIAFILNANLQKENSVIDALLVTLYDYVNLK